MEPKWGRPNVTRTSQLLHVIRRGVNGREEEEEDEEEKEDTAVSGHLCEDSHNWLQIDLKLQFKRLETLMMVTSSTSE